MRKFIIAITILLILSGCSFKIPAEKKQVQKKEVKSQENLLGGTGRTCGTYTVSGSGIDTNIYGTVLAKDGECWLDRNLGATEIAISKTDYFAYGWSYQWGRLTDGHQATTSPVTYTGSNNDIPNNGGQFIATTTLPNNWRYPKNDNLWQGVNGINNPCPSGFRLPTITEWSALAVAEGITNGTSDDKAFNSSLKLTTAKYRDKLGDNNSGNGYGYYQSSSISTNNAQYFWFNSSIKGTDNTGRAYAYTVRCVQGDTCTYSGSGDWTVQQSDNCYITSNVYVNGAFNLIGSSTGMFDCAPGVKVSATKFNFDHSQAPTRINSNCKAYHF